MTTSIDTININWKTNKEFYNSIYRYIHYINNNRIYFITWKLQTSISGYRINYNAILWQFTKRNCLSEEIIKYEFKQKGIKIVMLISDTDREYNTIWTIGKNIKLDKEFIINYIEIQDLLNSNLKNLVPPKEFIKFNKNILYLYDNKWIRNGIIISEYERQFETLLEDIEKSDSDNLQRYINTHIYIHHIQLYTRLNQIE